MTLSGDLRTMPFAEVFAFVGQRRGLGMVSIESIHARKEICLSNGRVVSCTTGSVKERLGQRLIAAGRIREVDLITSLDEQDRSGERLGRILVSNCLLDETELFKALSEQAHASLVDLFSWQSGCFSFHDVEHLPNALVPMDVPVEDVLMAGRARSDRARWLRNMLPEPRARFKVNSSRYPEGFPSTRIEGGLIHLALTGVSAIEACMHRHEDDFELLSTFAQLVEEGILEPQQLPQTDVSLSSSQALIEADKLVAVGRWERALHVLQQAMQDHGEGGGLSIAAVRIKVKARERLTWAGGLDVVPAPSPQLEEQGTSSLDGAEVVIGERVNGLRPLRAVVRGCPLEEDLALASVAGLFERGLLHLRQRASRASPGLTRRSGPGPGVAV